MSPIYTPARGAKLEDLAAMSKLPKHPGHTSVGPRSLAFCHPNHSKDTLEGYFSTFPQGIFISEDDSGVVAFSCAIRASEKVVRKSFHWSDGTVKETTLSHQKDGNWLYVSRLAYTAGPGHAHISQEVGPLLAALQELAVRKDLAGVAFAARFPGFRERSGTSSFQRSCIDDEYNQVRSGMHPIGVAYHVGFRHCLALPNYLEDGRHFALMFWSRNISS